MYFPSVFTYLSIKNICVTNDHGYVPLAVNTPRLFPNSFLVTGFVTISKSENSLIKSAYYK